MKMGDIIDDSSYPVQEMIEPAHYVHISEKQRRGKIGRNYRTKHDTVKYIELDINRCSLNVQHAHQ